MRVKTLKSRVRLRINKSKGSVFTPGDFFDLSGRDQVGRALRELVAEDTIIRFGQGLYAKAKRSSVTGTIIPIKPLPDLAREALEEKLKVKLMPNTDVERYNSSESTQVPTGRVITVKGRVNRKMSFNGKSIKLRNVS
ncbi:MAG: hypothetical protein ACJAW0_001954 [Zhongshania sp.]|jgi:hypothetical protein